MESIDHNAAIADGSPATNAPQTGQSAVQESSIRVGQIQVAATSFFALFSIVGLALYGLPFFTTSW